MPHRQLIEGTILVLGRFGATCRLQKSVTRSLLWVLFPSALEPASPPLSSDHLQKYSMATVPSTPTIMPTHPTPNPPFASPSLVRVSCRHKTIIPKYDLIELPDSFRLHGEVLSV